MEAAKFCWKSTYAKIGGGGFWLMAASYLTLFVIYGVLLGSPSGADTAARIEFIIAQQGILHFSYVVGYVLFGLALGLCVVALYQQYRQGDDVPLQLVSLMGLCWAILLICTGLIGITSLTLLAQYQGQTEAVTSVFYTSILLESALGGGIEFIGGMWVAMLGVLGLTRGVFSLALSWFSLFKGAIGIATLFFTEPVLRDLFGLTGIVWFIWMGASVITYPTQK